MSLVSSPSWRKVLQTANALVLYDPPSHALTVLRESTGGAGRMGGVIYLGDERRLPGLEGAEGGGGGGSEADDDVEEKEVEEEDLCPYCRRPRMKQTDASSQSQPFPSSTTSALAPASTRYFSILSQANTPVSSPPSTPKRNRPSATRSKLASFFAKVDGDHRGDDTDGGRFEEEEEEEDGQRTDGMPSDSRSSGANSGGRRGEGSARMRDENRGAEGYYKRFFKEEKRLGMGANGTVWLCQHVLDNEPLGLYAVKKVAVGDSHDYLAKILKEVKLLQRLRHENIVVYHHAWIEPTRFSRLAPPIQALHILMQYASSGSLEDYILSRTSPPTTFSSSSYSPSSEPSDLPLSAEAAKAAFRARRASSQADQRADLAGGGAGRRPFRGDGLGGERRGVHLLGKEEIREIFGGVVRGLEYLHVHDILHLDLKCLNVLLHLEEGETRPRALISDFGTSRVVAFDPDKIDIRSGNTGTLEYASPESLELSRQVGKEGDLWSLGLILHKLCFFKLPFSQIEDFEKLEKEIKAYPGFVPTPAVVSSFERRGLPRELLLILSGLLNIDASRRLSCSQVLRILKHGLEDASVPYTSEPYSYHSLAPFIPRRTSPPVTASSLLDEVFVDDDDEPLSGLSAVDGDDPPLTQGDVGRRGGRTLSVVRRSSSSSSRRTEKPLLLPSLRQNPSPLHSTLLLQPPRILYPPSARSPLNSSLSVLLYHPSFFILLKFLSLYAIFPPSSLSSPPSLGLQSAVLVMALASTSSSGVAGSIRGPGQTRRAFEGLGRTWEVYGLFGHGLLLLLAWIGMIG